MNKDLLFYFHHKNPHNRVVALPNTYLTTAMMFINFNFCSIPYRKYVGGVLAMTKAHFMAVNGYSNLYFGWGGEDDDMSRRSV